jgi:membrane protein implicated in regulation of membrane protease activity
MATDLKNYDPALMYGAGITSSGTVDAGDISVDGTTITATPAEIIQAADNSVNCEIVTATNAITAAESGATFFLNSATEFVSTLPAPALGLRYTFIVSAAPSGASYTVVTTSSANIIKGLQQSVAGDAGDSGTADDTITFVDGQAVAGDRVDVISDGTSWFAYANSKVAAGITFTQAS